MMQEGVERGGEVFYFTTLSVSNIVRRQWLMKSVGRMTLTGKIEALRERAVPGPLSPPQ